MLKQLIAIVLLLGVSPLAMAKGEVLCLKPVEVNIKRLYPPMHIVDGLKRKSEIALRMPVDCESGGVREPSSFAEAQDWLELALPPDFKRGITGGPYLNPYMYTLYGSSVEDDLYGYFTTQWKLGPTSRACKDAPPDPDIDPEGNTCFYQLIDNLRAQYKKPAAVIPEPKG